MAEGVAELERPVRSERHRVRRASTAEHALLVGIVVAQLAWVAGLVLGVVALVG
jgi:hypothetical protein